MLRRIFSDSSSQSQGEAVAILVEQLLDEPNYKSLIGQLDTVRIEQAKLTLRDTKTGITWVAPAARGQLKRDAAGVSISADARFASGGDPIDVALTGVYARDRSRFSVDANVDGLKPSMFADLSPDAVLLRGLDIALSGRLHIDGDGKGDVRNVAIDVTGGNGRVTLPGVLPASHQVRSVNARATVDAATHTVKVERIDVDFGAAKILVTGTGTKTPEGQVFAGRAEVLRIPVDRLGDYWPLEFATGGRGWALANLSNGQIDVAAEFALSAPGNDLAQIKVDRLVGLIDYRGMTVRYMPHMPELQGVVGQGALRGRHAAFRRGERHHRGPAHVRRHDRPHRAGRAGAAICQPPPADRRIGARRHPLPGATQARPVPRHALRLPAGRRRGRDRPVAALPAARVAHRRRARHQGRGAGVEVLAEECPGRARPHRRRGAGQVRRLRAQRYAVPESSTATWSRSAGASCSAPRCRFAAATTSRARCRPTSWPRRDFPRSSPTSAGPSPRRCTTRWRPTARARWSAASRSRAPRPSCRRSAGPRSRAPTARRF